MESLIILCAVLSAGLLLMAGIGGAVELLSILKKNGGRKPAKQYPAPEFKEKIYGDRKEEAV